MSLISRQWRFRVSFTSWAREAARKVTRFTPIHHALPLSGGTLTRPIYLNLEEKPTTASKHIAFSFCFLTFTTFKSSSLLKPLELFSFRHQKATDKLISNVLPSRIELLIITITIVIVISVLCTFCACSARLLRPTSSSKWLRAPLPVPALWWWC